MTSGLNFNLTNYGTPRLLANEVSQAITPLIGGCVLKKKNKMRTDVFRRQADRHTQDKGRGVASIFFSCKIRWNCLGSDSFTKQRRSIHGLNCHSFNFFKLLNSSLKTKTELYNSLFCAVVVCLTSFFVRRTLAHHAEFN